MHLGIDVGGTHTDAVAMRGNQVAASCKIVTDHDNLLISVRAALDKVLGAIHGERVARLNLSTTLTTNAIVSGKTEDVGVLVTAGPGIDPEFHRIGRGYHLVGGALDHRGFEITPLPDKDVKKAIAACKKMGMRVFAVVGKFSTRNPAHELAVRKALGKSADFVTMGHRLSGLLNFPRRISTAYYNAAVWRLYNSFADAIEQSAKERNLDAPLNILKADGGTMPLSISRERPVESILSGPAASVMGIIALCDIREDCAILDIGGTTTDIAIFAGGAPIIETKGIEVGSYPTLVRALKTHSIGVGGDSKLRIREDRIFVGPEREGPSMAQGGERPTLIDAFNYQGLSSHGDRQASIRGIEQMAALWDMPPAKLAEKAIARAVEQIKNAVDELVWSINQKPVYTINELLTGKEIRPTKLYAMGGPAMAFQSRLHQAFGLEVEVPDNYDVANAVGAALTRTTCDLELFADTQKRQLFFPALGEERGIPSSYNLEQAEKDTRERLLAHLEEIMPLEAARLGGSVETIEANSFNMVDDYGGTGRNIRVKCQIKPGISVE
jgi:N-methylhydantoinase A/oxoprolinase/acetone carboxylase beta subunit